MTLGVDLGDRLSQLGVRDGSGAVPEDGRLSMCEAAFRPRFETAPRARIAIEAGTHAPWVSAPLAEIDHGVVVANPRKLRMIFKSNSKNDRRDAEEFARVAPMDPKLLSPIQHRERSTRMQPAAARARDTLVAAWTRMVDRVPGSHPPFVCRSARSGRSRSAPWIRHLRTCAWRWRPSCG